MDNLPAEIFYYLNQFLNLNDQLNLGSTCKKLRNFYFEKRLKKLALFVDKYPFYYELINSNEQIGFSNSLKVANVHQLFKSLFFKNWFRDIKKLIIIFDNDSNCDKMSYKIDVNDLNYYGELIEHLEIKILKLNCGILKLSKLNTCYIDTKRESRFTMIAPMLNFLKINNQAEPILQESHSLMNLIFLNGSYDYLIKLFQQCTNLSSLTLGSYVLLKRFIIFKITQTDTVALHVNLNEIKLNEIRYRF